MYRYSLSIHLFRRDLRLHDNTALIAALKQSAQVIPVFIFDERQLDNPYRGDNSFRFLLQSLAELNGELKKRGSHLYLFRGIAEEVVAQLIGKHPVEALFFNRDYTPFSRKRDEAINAKCSTKGVAIQAYADGLLTEPEMVHKDDGLPYTVFTPFYRRAQQLAVSRPADNPFGNYYSRAIDSEQEKLVEALMPPILPMARVKGGRTEGLKLLNEARELEAYNDIRNLPAVKGTSLLSAHHKFGTISIRETFHATSHFPTENSFHSELYWRDFFTHIGFHFPHVFGKAFREKYDAIPWCTSNELFERWCAGQTGFPLIDAGMRELVQTGYMHNRVRMVVASFLTKDLHTDWRLGERFFANHLADYDPAVNNGNWQWAASTGCDAQPYFRIFNPWNQQQKFDPQCAYIKRWVPDLGNVLPDVIHNLWKKFPTGLAYPRPMTEHSDASKQALLLFKQVAPSYE